VVDGERRMSSERVANIGPSGARRRLVGGYVWAAATAVAFVALLATHAPRELRLGLVVPLFLAGIGIFQARAKT
jgi:hypothetical protein